MAKIKAITPGTVFGRLTVRESVLLEKGANPRHQYICACACGNTSVVPRKRLVSGNTRSCGCRDWVKNHGYLPRHGESGKRATPEYSAWCGIRARCGNKNNKDYKNYGGRGIRVCDRWLESYENFLADMGRRPSPQHSIDRKDVNGNYEPGNCRWATAVQQQCNRTNTRLIKFRGEVMPVSYWAARFCVSRKKLDRLIAERGEIGALEEISHQAMVAKR